MLVQRYGVCLTSTEPRKRAGGERISKIVGEVFAEVTLEGGEGGM